MSTKQIDYILELAQVNNFNRAAKNLFISQPTLTYQIKTVEETYRRSPHSVCALFLAASH